MVTPLEAGSRQAKRRAVEAIGVIIPPHGSQESTAAEKSINKAKRLRIDSTANAMLHVGKVKVAAPKKNTDADDDDSADGTVVEYSWPAGPSTSRTHACYTQIRMSLTSLKQKRKFNVRRGGCIKLLTANGKQLFCSVNRFITRVANGRQLKDGDVKVEGYWLLNRTDLLNHFGNAVTPECQEYMDKLQRNELVLTNTSCSLDIAGIEGNIRVLYIEPNQPVPTELPSDTYICRFTLKIETTRGILDWGVVDLLKLSLPVVDDVVEEVVDTISDDINKESSVKGSFSSASADTGNETDTSSSVEEISRVTIREGGSATLRTSIKVGPKFQVVLEPFNSGAYVQSRKPMLIHKANAISDNELFDFLNNVAEVHNKYLFQYKMTVEEPYSPLSHVMVEKVTNETPGVDRLTGSFLSTSSMLAGKRCRLMKECDSDALLELLAFHDYDTKSALQSVQSNLNGITAGWSRHEKDIFDDTFRRNNGSLRKITKAIAPMKHVKDVIDYFYRFKVSDQFRKFQDKKRELAVRMVECIEKKKYYESLSSTSYSGSVGSSGATVDVEETERPSHWLDKSTSSMTVARDDRIHAAKRLLLDVKDHLGSKRMADIASVIRQLQERYEPNGRSVLFDLLDGHPELQRRFFEFLPKHF